MFSVCLSRVGYDTFRISPILIISHTYIKLRRNMGGHEGCQWINFLFLSNRNIIKSRAQGPQRFQAIVISFALKLVEMNYYDSIENIWNFYEH